MTGYPTLIGELKGIVVRDTNEPELLTRYDGIKMAFGPEARGTIEVRACLYASLRRTGIRDCQKVI